MRVNLNTNKNNKPNFGMAIKATPKAKELLYSKNLSRKETIKLNRLITSQENNNTDIYLSTVQTKNGNKLKADLGLKSYTENYINNALSIIEKAVKAADKVKLEKTDFEAKSNGAHQIIKKLQTPPSIND